MLAVSIICILLESILYIWSTVMLVDESTRGNAWVMPVLLLICTIVCAIGLVFGIKRIRKRESRGLGIATTAVSGFGTMLGFIFTLYAFYIIAVFNAIVS